MDNEDKINELKDALRQVVQLVVARGSPLPPDLKALLAQAMEHVAQRIRELRAGESPAEGLAPTQQQPKLEPGPYPSSNINSFKYDYPTGKLLVKFHGKDSADSGPIYSYDNVPRFIYDIFRKGAVPPKSSGRNQYHEWIKGVTPSLGAAMYHLIRNSYPYQRVS